MKPSFRNLFLILFSRNGYEAIQPQSADHQSKFRDAFWSSFAWTVGSFLAGVIVLWLAHRVNFWQELEPSKVLASVGVFLAGWGTWLQLATPEDTWDVSERLDTKLRGFAFKCIFAPGLVLSLLGSAW